MKRVLITGATGFIGRMALPFLLEKGYEVHAVTTSSSQVSEKVIWHTADLFDPQQTSALFDSVKPSHLLHFAWYAIPGKFWSANENLTWVEASLRLLKFFVKNGGKRVVMAGTCAEYDWSEGHCDETSTSLAPSTFYGECKQTLQQMASLYCRETDVSFAWGRIFHLYGPHEHPNRLVSSVILSLLKQQPARCSHGCQIRDLMHVRDVASAFVAILESDVEGCINVASGSDVALKDVIGMIGDKTGEADLVQLGALQAPVNDPKRITASCKRLFDEVKWKPSLSLDVGLDETIDWWKTQLLQEVSL